MKQNRMNTNRPKVSVIVAVYMAEAYIDRCMRSLLCQTLKEIEVILVDDGSTDRSGEICDSYAAKDTRVKVIHKQNEGVSLARQCGIDNMTGEYSIHVDPDDWIEPVMLEIMYGKAKSENLDIVACGFVLEYKDRQEVFPQDFSSTTHEAITELLLRRREFSPSLSNKIIRNSLYKKLGLSFPAGMDCGEDMAVVLRLILSGCTIGYCGLDLYHYDRHINPNSMTEKRLNDRMFFARLMSSYPAMKRCFRSRSELRVFNTYLSNIAYDTFYDDDITAREGIKLFLKHIKVFMQSNISAHRKINLTAAAFGLAPAIKPLYKKIQQLS